MLVNTLIQRKLRLTLLLIAVFVMPATSFAQNIALIYDKNSKYQNNFIDILSKQLSANKNVNLTTVSAASLSIPTLKKGSIDLIVNLDNDAAKKLILSNVQTTTLHALTTLSRARHYAPCLPNCKNNLANHQFFVLDQPPARQLGLIQLINPVFKNVGIIVTSQSKSQLTSLKKVATHKKLVINEYISNSENIRYLIDEISKSSDIILAIADTNIYNATSLSQILLTSYRYKTPIIGFSKGFIRAGAIAGSVSSIDQLAQHLSERILESNKADKALLKSIIYPKYFNVISNRNVAKSLNLHFPNDDELKAQLMSYESTRPIPPKR